MDPATLLKMLGPAVLAALGTAMVLLAAGALFLPKSPFGKRLGQGLMPFALAAGFVAGYSVLFDWPHGTADQPWYLDVPWKMPVVMALVAGALLTIARLIPRPLGQAILSALLVLAQTLLLVHGPWLTSQPWDSWILLAAFIAGAISLYLSSLIPSARDSRLWLLGPLILWACISVTAIINMAWVDQSLGKMLILLAVLAGLACITGIARPMRSIAAGSAPFLATLFAGLLMLMLRYNDVLPTSVMILAACGPLAAGVAWLPALRKRPLACVIVALLVMAAFLVPAIIIAVKNGPALE